MVADLRADYFVSYLEACLEKNCVPSFEPKPFALGTRTDLKCDGSGDTGPNMDTLLDTMCKAVMASDKHRARLTKISTKLDTLLEADSSLVFRVQILIDSLEG